MSQAELIAHLRRLLGDRLLTEREDLVAYSRDASKLTRLPLAVAQPESEAEVVEIVRACLAHSVPLTPRGAASGLTGGAVPASGGLVLDLNRMNRLLSLDPDEQVAVVEPGMVVGELNRIAAKHNLQYAADPGSSAFCTVGGTVAENAGGMLAVRYGVTRDQVLALRAVIGTGEVIQVGRATRKDVAGYDLVSLMVGSEGTLGIITQIALKLTPLPDALATATVLYAEESGALSAAATLVRHRLPLRALEFMDRSCVRLVAETQRLSLPGVGREELAQGRWCLLLVECEGDTPEEARRRLGQVEEVLARSEGGGRFLPCPEGERERVWQIRKSLHGALFTQGLELINEDLCVPRTALPAFIGKIYSSWKKLLPELALFVYGHAGDGNLHIEGFSPPEQAGEVDRERIDELRQRLMEAAVALGGTISGEHGVGLTKTAYLGLMYGEAELSLMARLKRAFDPQGILNPGKILGEFSRKPGT